MAGPAARFMADVKRLLEGDLENYIQVDTPENKISLDQALLS